MTAFASSEVNAENLTIYCNLRSVNHRYCDVTLKLPECFRFSESELRAAINNKIKRGKVECALSYQKIGTDANELMFSSEAVNALLAAAYSIEKLIINPKSFSALEILNFPGVQQEQKTDTKQTQLFLCQAVEEALANLLVVREREGKQLRLLLEQRGRIMLQFVAQAKARMPEVLQLIRRRIKQRLEELVAEPEPDRLEQEMVFLTQKLDVAEELDRLETHINEVFHVLTQDQPVGRRLDFLMQEMNREANTLGSKSMDKEMTRISIELKVLIEQMREQVQNIE